MKINKIDSIGNAFEVSNNGRMLPMEGLRGIAVGFVFLQHYCTQFKENASLHGLSRSFAEVFAHIGNYGVELFFVLSGFLIYGMLLKRPPFVSFMARRAIRLYPAFLVALIIGILAELARPNPKIPAGIDGYTYLAENLLFLPGLLPIEPISAVNWSLSYEWWFYISATALFSVLGLSLLSAAWRTVLIAAMAISLVSLSAVGMPYVPIRGLCLFGGMLLAEARVAKAASVPAPVGIVAAVVSIGMCIWWPMPLYLMTITITLGFCALCSSAFAEHPLVARPLSWKYLRWFGNISYSYYLVHGFVVVLSVRAILGIVGTKQADWLFWISLLPVFLMSFVASAVLFLTVEKPISLRRSTAKIVLANSA